MSDAKARGQGSPVGKGLTSSAKPFVPTQSDGERVALASASSAVFAAPFIPSFIGNQSNQRHSAPSRRGADGESQNVVIVLVMEVA